MIAKAQLKAYLSRNDAAYWTAAVLYEYAQYPAHIWRQGLTRRALGLRGRRTRDGAQTMLDWRVDLPAIGTPQDLGRWLRAKGLSVCEGGHAFYVAPQPGLADLFPPVVDFYPRQSGFKILKDFRHPTRARYLYKDRYALRFLSRLIGSPQDQVLAANYLYAGGAGARLWDLASWTFHDTCCTVFVVEHIDGVRPDAAQCAEFLSRLRRLDASSLLRVLVPRWTETEDFAPPDCNRNLIYSAAHGRAIYVDFQNFGLTDYGAWVSELAANARPEAADAKTRVDDWNALQESLRRSGETVAGRVVADVECRDAAILSRSLAAGAAWVVGWCSVADARRIEHALLARGMTRFTLLTSGAAEGVPADAPAPLRARLHDAVVFGPRNSRESHLFEEPRSWR